MLLSAKKKKMEKNASWREKLADYSPPCRACTLHPGTLLWSRQDGRWCQSHKAWWPPSCPAGCWKASHLHRHCTCNDNMFVWGLHICTNIALVMTTVCLRASHLHKHCTCNDNMFVWGLHICKNIALVITCLLEGFTSVQTMHLPGQHVCLSASCQYKPCICNDIMFEGFTSVQTMHL